MTDFVTTARRAAVLAAALVLTAIAVPSNAAPLPPLIVGLECQTWAGQCDFICVPGYIEVHVNGRTVGKDVYAVATCNDEPVASCFAHNDFCEGRGLYEGPVIIGTCEAGPYNEARCNSGGTPT